MRLQMTRSLADPDWQDLTGSESATTAILPVNESDSAFFRLVADATLPPPGMVAWWPGDGHARDIIGGHDGLLQNGAGYAPGMVGDGFLYSSLVSVWVSASIVPDACQPDAHGSLSGDSTPNTSLQMQPLRPMDKSW